MTLLRFGISLASVTPLADDARRLYGRVRDVAVACEDAGWDALFVPDHVCQGAIGGGVRAPMFEAYTLLGALSAATTTIQLGAFVSPVTFRNPGLLAKAVTTVDVVSGGRAVLGIGAGVTASEHEAYGIPFPPIGERLARLEDAVAICRRMFDEEAATVAGGHHTVTEAWNMPRPLRRGLPILIGGGGERGTLRLVARFADACNLPPAPLADLRRKLDVLARHCDDAGRDPDSVTTTAFVLPPEGPAALVDTVGALLGIGLDGVVVAASGPSVEAVHAWGGALHGAFGRGSS